MSSEISVLFLFLRVLTTADFFVYCQRASRAKTRGLPGGELNAVRSIAAVRKILDRAVISVM